jgi:ureidoglycolate amidohydrolase
MQIESEWLQQQIDRLAVISEEPAPVVTRILFSDADLSAREHVKRLQ